MTRHIIVAITPDEDGVRCGECFGPDEPVAGPECECEWKNWKNGEYHRGPLCLAAERKLAALIEAGNKLRDESWRRFPVHSENGAAWDRTLKILWDRAVKEAEE